MDPRRWRPRRHEGGVQVEARPWPWRWEQLLFFPGWPQRVMVCKPNIRFVFLLLLRKKEIGFLHSCTHFIGWDSACEIKYF